MWLDWARGVAVVLMVLSHTVDAWTRDADRDRTAYYWTAFLGGLAAPAFLFLAGLGTALSGAAQQARGRPRADIRSALVWRGVYIFGLALVFRFQSFVLGLGSPAGLFKVDILNVMGPALMLAAVLWGAAARVPGRILMAAVATAAIAMAAPLVGSAGWVDALPPPLQWYLRSPAVPSGFTLLPWAGFVCAGLGVGAVVAAATTVRAQRRVQTGLALLALVVAGVAYWASLQPTIYPPGRSTFWEASPAFFFLRLGLISALLPLCWAASALVPQRFGAWLATLGAASLFVYWVHVEFLYGGLAVLIKRRMPLEWTLVSAALLAYGLVRLVPRARQWVAAPNLRLAPVRRLVARLL